MWCVCVWVYQGLTEWMMKVWRLFLRSCPMMPTWLSPHHPQISWFPTHSWSQESSQNHLGMLYSAVTHRLLCVYVYTSILLSENKMHKTVYSLLYFKNRKRNRTSSCAVTWPPFVCTVHDLIMFNLARVSSYHLYFAVIIQFWAKKYMLKMKADIAFSMHLIHHWLVTLKMFS